MYRKQLLSFMIAAGMLIAPAAFLFAQSDTSRYFTSFDGVKIYYEVRGTGKPVVLIHGFIVNGQSWKHTAVYQDLLDMGYKVIIPDMRGNGRSDKPHTPESYANDAEAKDVMGIVKDLGLKNYSVIGYSRGSIITARLMVLDKSIIHSVMGGMGTAFTNPEWPRRKMFYRALIGDTVKELEAMVKNVQASGLDQLALAYLQKEQPSTSTEVLSKLNTSLLVLCGSEDEDNGAAADLSRLIPHSIFITVPGNHNTALRSKEFANAIIDFLK